jgi:hypothetical protein|tara:strand:- start:60 stop:497 length:438 start_codon:yes stop_codon:yes gene_type:complete
MKDNKLIAEFMGLRTNSYGDYNIDKDVMGFDMIVCSLADTKFHESWDWLMPVVEKIEAELEEEFRVVTLEHECSIHQKTEDQKLQDAFQCVAQKFGTSKIEATYNAVVEFIKQYNKYICGSCGDHVNEVVFNEDTDVDECKNCTL